MLACGLHSSWNENLIGLGPCFTGSVLDATCCGIGERAVIVATRSSDLGYVSDSYMVRLLSGTQSYVPP